VRKDRCQSSNDDVTDGCVRVRVRVRIRVRIRVKG
jgi:hypothetical protein